MAGLFILACDCGLVWAQCWGEGTTTFAKVASPLLHMGKAKQTILGKRDALSLISITTLLLQTARVRYRPRYNAHRAYTLPFDHFKLIFL